MDLGTPPTSQPTTPRSRSRSPSPPPPSSPWSLPFPKSRREENPFPNTPSSSPPRYTPGTPRSPSPRLVRRAQTGANLRRIARNALRLQRTLLRIARIEASAKWHREYKATCERHYEACRVSQEQYYDSLRAMAREREAMLLEDPKRDLLNLSNEELEDLIQ